tara:strand:- start:3839 stop:4045 length:207 start_codon:yes stop_codon:yes gene_type:complete
MSIEAMKMFMLMGDMTSENNSLEEKVAYKERIAFATMRNAIPDWQPPENWDTLSNEIKMERLSKLTEL